MFFAFHIYSFLIYIWACVPNFALHSGVLNHTGVSSLPLNGIIQHVVGPRFPFDIV